MGVGLNDVLPNLIDKGEFLFELTLIMFDEVLEVHLHLGLCALL